MAFEKIAFRASPAPEAQETLRELSARYVDHALGDADVIVAIGGDGFMLQTLHGCLDAKLPIYGVNRGTVGFLMNAMEENDLIARLAHAETAVIHPLVMKSTDRDGQTSRALAINEVSLLRETRQTAKLRISVDGKVRLEELLCDGVLVATPAGSTAYNLSAHGPILPLDARLLALTPISAFRPRRWRGALLSHEAKVRFDVLEADKRPVSAVADHTEVRNVVRVDVTEDRSIALKLLFDEGHSLDERILSEQFIH